MERARTGKAERRSIGLQDMAATLLGQDGGWRTTLAEAVAPEPHDVVLEGGCGAGGLIHLLARMTPDADFVGMDPDEALVAQARSRTYAGGGSGGGSQSYIVADVADAALHLGAWTPTRVILNFTRDATSAARLAQLHGVRQIIDPSGMLFVASSSEHRAPLLQSLLATLRGGGDPTGNIDMGSMIRAAGFVAVEEFAVRAGAGGSVSLFRARAS